MSIGQFFSILRARWWLSLAVLAIIVAAVVVGSLLWPKSYTAVASVVVDSKPDPVSALIYPGMVSPAFMATQVDIIQSDRVAFRVIQNLKLAQQPGIQAQWREATDGQGTIESYLAVFLQKAMDVKPSLQSNVITLSYKSAEPRFAATLANAYVQAYIDTTLELKVDPAKQYGTFFESRARDARAALEKAQTRLSAFQSANGIVATDERLDVENARLNELSSQLVAIQGLTSDSTSRQAQSRGGAAESMQEVLTNPMVASLRNQISQQDAKYQELNARLGDRNPQVLDLAANTAELRKRLADETRNATSGIGVTSAINRQRESQLRSDLDQQRTKVLRMKQVRDEGAVLVKDVENAEKTYDAISARLTQSTLESQATQSNINVLTPASVPISPSSPKVFRNILISVFGGTLLAIGAALLAELLDRRVRTNNDILTMLDLPVIGWMPKPLGKSFSSKFKPTLMQQRVIGSLAGGNKGAV